MARSRRRYITKSLIQQHGETPGCSACLGIASQHTAKCRERFEKLINPNATDVIPASANHHGGRSTARQQCSPSSAAAGGLAWDGTARPGRFRQPDVEMSTAPVPDDAMEVDALCGHGDDFHTEGEPETLDEVDMMILGTFTAKVLPRSRATGRDQRDVLVPLTASEATVFRRSTGIALCLDPDRLRPTVCNERARTRHANARQDFDDETQTDGSCSEQLMWGRFLHTRANRARCWSGQTETGAETRWRASRS